MAGIKLRMPGGDAWQFLGQSLGANPTPMAYAEVYTGLQTGAIDGQDNPLPNVAEHEVLRGDVADRADLAPRRLRPARRHQRGLERDDAGAAGRRSRPRPTAAIDWSTAEHLKQRRRARRVLQGAGAGDLHARRRGLPRPTRRRCISSSDLAKAGRRAWSTRSTRSRLHPRMAPTLASAPPRCAIRPETARCMPRPCRRIGALAAAPRGERRSRRCSRRCSSPSSSRSSSAICSTCRSAGPHELTRHHLALAGAVGRRLRRARARGDPLRPASTARSAGAPAASWRWSTAVALIVALRALAAGGGRLRRLHEGAEHRLPQDPLRLALLDLS